MVSGRNHRQVLVSASDMALAALPWLSHAEDLLLNAKPSPAAALRLKPSVTGRSSFTIKLEPRKDF